MSFLWKDDYKIDIEEIDEQHRRLFELGRELYRWIMTEDTAEQKTAAGIIIPDSVQEKQEVLKLLQ